MKLLMLSTLSLLFIASRAQTESPQSSDLAVLKFSCGEYQTRGSMVRSVHEPDESGNEPIRINQERRNEPQEVINSRDMAERRAELRTTEINAALSTQKAAKLYFYHLEVKNNGSRAIKSFAWEYQSRGVPDPSDRHFFCVVNAKPNQKKQFDLFTPLAPSRVVDVTTASEKPGNSKGVVVINKIEYAEGTTWVRPGWNAATFSAEATQKVEAGKCVGL
ncbi:MAG: hypothetical protein ACT4OT_01415 [Acidobacteriota bacterium]